MARWDATCARQVANAESARLYFHADGSLQVRSHLPCLGLCGTDAVMKDILERRVGNAQALDPSAQPWPWHSSESCRRSGATSTLLTRDRAAQMSKDR